MAGPWYAGGGSAHVPLSPNVIERLMERGEIPAWEQVEPFVSACLRSRIDSAEEVTRYLEHGRTGWQAVRATTLPAAPSAPPLSSPAPPGSEQPGGSSRGRIIAVVTAVLVLAVLVSVPLLVRHRGEPTGDDQGDLALPTVGASASPGGSPTPTAAASGPITQPPPSNDSGPLPPPPRPGPVRIRVVKTNLCLSEDSGSSGWLYQLACGKQMPAMTLKAVGDGTYQIQTMHPTYGPGCTGVSDGSSSLGVHVLDDYCGSGRGQVFRVEPVRSPLRGYRLKPIQSKNGCIGVEGNSPKAHTPVLQLACDSAATGQVFLFDSK